MSTLQAYTFSIKHKKGVTNKVEDALSRRVLTIQEVQLQSVGLNDLKDLYQGDKDFGEAFEVCTKFTNVCHVAYYDFMLQEGLLFKGHLLCIPQCSMRDNIIKEKHQGSLGGHFGLDKTLE